MIFISAGHNSKSKKVKQDPGAIGNGYKEGDLTIDFRDRVCKELDALKIPYIKDSDEETLAMYLQRIKTGPGSVVIEYHFDAAVSPAATGTTGLIEGEADRFDKAFAKEITDTTAAIVGCILFWVMVISLASCNPAKQAIKHLNKAYSKSPVTVARYTRDKFPCVTTKVDTSIKYLPGKSVFIKDTQYLTVDCPEVTAKGDTVYKPTKVKVPCNCKEKTDTLIINTTEKVKDSSDLFLFSHAKDSLNQVISRKEKIIQEKESGIKAITHTRNILWYIVAGIAAIIGVSVFLKLKFGWLKSIF